MTFEATVVPRFPYSLALTARASGDLTRRFSDGVLTVALEADGRPALVRVWQRRDGSLAVVAKGAATRAALERIRFVLAADENDGEFIQRFSRDPLLGEPIRRLRGLRPLRVATVAHALVKAVCGQLIQARAARALEARLLRAAAREHEGLRLPPDRSTFARFSPAELVREGLAGRKAATLVRLSGDLELERLHELPTEAAAARIERERGLGPWSAGVICLYGLGRFERGLVGDLGLVKLCAALHGRWATADDTRALLEPYGEWAGLASFYLLAGARWVRPPRAPVRVRARDDGGGGPP